MKFCILLHILLLLLYKTHLHYDLPRCNKHLAVKGPTDNSWYADSYSVPDILIELYNTNQRLCGLPEL